MPASSSDLVTRTTTGSRPVATTLTASKAGGVLSISTAALTGWPTTTGVHFALYKTDTSGEKIAGSQTDWEGVVSGTSIGSMVLKAGTDNGYAIGDTVEAMPTAAWADGFAQGFIAQHSQLDGSHTAVTAVSLAVSGASNLSGATTISGTFTPKLWDGWISSVDTWTYVSATTFKITGSDVTAKFPVGTKIKLTQTTAKYFYVTAASFSTDTTVTITGGTDYTLANAAITAPFYSYESSPQGHPIWFNYTVTYTGFSVAPTSTNRFKVDGRTVTLNVYPSANGTSNATTFTVTAPLTSTNFGSFIWYGWHKFVDNGSAANNFGLLSMANNTTTINVYQNTALVGWTATAAKSAAFTGFQYEI